MFPDESALLCVENETPFHELESDGSRLICIQSKTPFDELESSGKLLVETRYNLLHYRFHQFLSSFFEEISSNKCFWPFPPMLGDGKSVDLFKLFFLVRENGGYGNVTENGLWDFITSECGLELEHTAALKLVYVKYLNELEKCLASGLKDKKLEDQSILSSLSLDSLVMGLETELKGSLLDIPISKKTSKVISSNLLSVIKGGKGNSDDKVESEPTEIMGDQKKSDSDDDVMIVASSAWEEGSNRKRKRKSLSGMLDWVSETAKHPTDPVMGPLPDISKWRSYANDEPWKQILLYREKVCSYPITAGSISVQSPQQRNHKQCFYDDHAGPSYKLRDRATCTRNTRSELTTPPKPSKPERSSAEPVDHYMASMQDFFDDPTNIDTDDDWIPVGRKYQVDVPEWTGAVIPSDPRWLGTPIWPPAEDERKNLIERERTGKGRQESCVCKFPGSVDCVRLHIDEERKRLKHELGSVYRTWKIGKIGERAKSLWTPDEEKRFSDLKKTKTSSFWDEIKNVLPDKSRRRLVSYYFNVYLVNLRAYQNRHTPDEIESEDDEFVAQELVTTPLKHKGMKSPKALLRSPTKSCKKD